MSGSVEQFLLPPMRARKSGTLPVTTTLLRRYAHLCGCMANDAAEQRFGTDLEGSSEHRAIGCLIALHPSSTDGGTQMHT